MRDYAADIESGAAQPIVADTFAASRYRFAGKTVRATVPAGTTANIDLKVVGAAGRKLNGGFMFAIDAAFGDQVTFQIVDVDNILGYGAGVVLDEFLTWSIDPREQLNLDLPYGSDIPEGFYIRGIYQSVGTADVKVAINMKLHRKL
ncbi:MAG: hypothetical protein AAB927_02260 [Patescibacteria group bacterium]